MVQENAQGVEMFKRAKFVRWMGLDLLKLEDGSCQACLPVREDFLQQDGFVHAGILATMGDHCAGGAVGCMLTPQQKVLTIEFKTNFLRPAQASELFCHSQALKIGRSIAVAESEIYPTREAMITRDPQALIAKMTVSLAVLGTA